MNIYNDFLKKRKKFAILVDPDKNSSEDTVKIAKMAEAANVDYIFVGGSLLTNDNFESTIKLLKQNCSLPVVIFPGNNMQISNSADAILLLSLISGRNPEMLIGKHMIAAPVLKKSSLEIIPTGYMLIESGKFTTALYMSNSTPIPSDKEDIAVCTAIAGEMLGLKFIFMDAGSGAVNPVPLPMISKVKQNISIPLIIGGGIRTPEKAVEDCRAGADVVVVGNAIEKNPELISQISKAVHSEIASVR